MDGMTWLTLLWVHVAAMVAVLLSSDARELRGIFYDPQFSDIPRWLRFSVIWALFYTASLLWPAFLLYVITEKK